jgi:hypothetical protein
MAGGVGIELHRELDAWMEAVDKQYKSILAKHGVTENITFIGEASKT